MRDSRLLISCSLMVVVWMAIGECWPNRCTFRSLSTKLETHTVITNSTYRSEYLCGFAWWVMCSRYRVAYRNVTKLVEVYGYNYYTDDCSGHCHDYQCINCKGIDNCEDTRCTSSNDQYCVKCEFDRGGLKKAYDLVEDQGIQNRKCEQRCSWRPDSKFCYPGTCLGLPSTCYCMDGFYGNNCLKLTTNPEVENCAGKLKVIGSDITCDIDCGIDNIGYCQLDADSFRIDWTSSYIPSLDSIVKPYYVNDTEFGVVSASMQWNLTRDTIALDSGINTCLSDQTGIINIPTNELPRRSCSHQIDLDLDIQHNDRLSLTLTVRNGGFIYINNFDQENVIAIDGPFLYEGNTEEKTSVFIFDFLPPVHTVCQNDTDCSAKPININHPYTTNKYVTIRWLPEEWVDEPSGIDHYDCEAFRLTSNTSKDSLDMHSRTPVAWKLGIRPSDLEATLRLPDPGVYAIIMTLYDSAGNSAKVRRFVVYDDVSKISINVTRPITAAEAVQNGGVFWLTQSKTLLSWNGHFYNSLHRDKYMLNGIAELEPWPRIYDEVTGQPPTSRSREAIHNTDGIVFFQIDYAMSSSGKAEPHNWRVISDAEIEIYITSPDPENQSTTERLTFWLRAYDVIGHTAHDSVVFYIDRTQPVITNVTLIEDGRRTSGVRRVKVNAHDGESGILEIQWKLFDGVDSSLMYGEGTVNGISATEPSNPPCSPATCSCIPTLDLCSYREYLIDLDISALDDFPPNKTACTIFITVLNNAELSTTLQLEVELNAESPDNSVPVTAGESQARFASVPVVAVVIIVVVIVVVMHRQGKFTKNRKSSKLMNMKNEFALTPQGLESLSRGNSQREGFEDNEHANGKKFCDIEEDKYQSLLDSRDATYQSLQDIEDVKYESLKKADKSTRDSDGMVDLRCKPQVNSSNTNNGVSSLVNADRSMRTREQAEISSTGLILIDLLKPGIHKAKLSNMATSGTSVVVAKCLKDSSSVLQKEHLLNELDVMLSITPHVNVIELLGCIISSGSPKPCVVLEFATNGSLKDVLHSFEDGDSNVDKGTPSVSGDKLLSFADQIACGMEHLATLKIIHRKLGIRNIFVGKGKICKVGCFSHAVKTDKEFEEIRDCQKGRLPLRWMAPESLEECVFSLKTDVWTYGVMLWEIVTLGQTPYPGVSSREIAEYILNGRCMEKPAQCIGELYSLMLLCWALNPRNRPSMSVLRRELRFIIQNRYVLDGTTSNFKPYEDID